MELVMERRVGEIPMVGQNIMEAAHIIPFTLNNFDNKTTSGSEIVRDLLLSPGLMHYCTQKNCTWDMLESWTRIDFRKLVGSNINTPSNVVYMNESEHFKFRTFELYLDKEAVSRFCGDLSLLSLGLTFLVPGYS
jgi:HNH endonuclease